MRNFLTTVLLIFCVSLLAKDIGTTIKTNADSVWSLSPDKFKTNFGSPEIYKWEALKKVLLYNSAEGKTKLYFLQQQISKASFKFSPKHLQGMYLTFARSKAKTDRDTYLKNIKTLQDKINALDKFPRPKLCKRKSGIWYRFSSAWKSKTYTICLRWSYLRNSKAPFKAKATKFSIYYRGTPVVPVPDKQIIADKKSEAAADSQDGGDFYLKVPMIIETSRRYNLPSCINRIIKYYNSSDKDKKQTDKPSIVSTAKVKYNLLSRMPIKFALRKLLRESSFEAAKVIYPTCFEDYNHFMQLVADYNWNADNKIEAPFIKTKSYHKKRKYSKYFLIPYGDPALKKTYTNPDKKIKKYTYLINMEEILLRMNDERALLKTRTSRRSPVRKFKKKICTQINAGNPLLWDVILGMLKEESDPPSKGEYLRLIIGYNLKTDEIIYSDNLGKEHAVKKMSWDRAWAISYRVLILKRKKL